MKAIEKAHAELNKRLLNVKYADISMQDKLELITIRLDGVEVECSKDNKTWNMCATLGSTDGIHMYASRYYRIKKDNTELLSSIDKLEAQMRVLQGELNNLKSEL